MGCVWQQRKREEPGKEDSYEIPRQQIARARRKPAKAIARAVTKTKGTRDPGRDESADDQRVQEEPATANDKRGHVSERTDRPSQAKQANSSEASKGNRKKYHKAKQLDGPKNTRQASSERPPAKSERRNWDTDGQRAQRGQDIWKP